MWKPKNILAMSQLDEYSSDMEVASVVARRLLQEIARKKEILRELRATAGSVLCDDISDEAATSQNTRGFSTALALRGTVHRRAQSGKTS